MPADRKFWARHGNARHTSAWQSSVSGAGAGAFSKRRASSGILDQTVSWSDTIGAANASSGTSFWAVAGPLIGVLVVAVFGFFQWRRTQRHLEKSEAEKQRLEKEKLAWERERLALEQGFTVEQQRVTVETQERRRAEEQERLRLEAAMTASERALNREHGINSMLEGVRADLGHMKILDMSKPLDLATLYVQVRVREDEYGRYVREEEIARDAQGDPNTLLASQRERHGQGAATAVAPEDAIARFRCVVLLGDPGAGKTTMLRHLAFRLARRDRIGNLEVPVYVELRRFMDAKAESLLDFVAADWARRYGFEASGEWLEGELSAGRAALLLDGLDEVLAGDDADTAQAAYDSVTEEVNRLVTRYPKAAIAVTCRRAGWEGGLHTFRELEVLDFSWEQIQQFIARWFRDKPDRAHGLMRALAGNLRMQSLAANPLLLSLIAIVYERDLELPERRAELYNRCVDVLLREWDAHRGIQRYTRFTPDRKRDLLEEVAWHFHCAGRRYFPRDELLDVIAGFLPTIRIDPAEHESILEEIAEQYGLLKAQAPGWYGFLHLTLQEYFAAIAANGRQEEGVQTIAGHIGESWWEEVTVLLAGRMADASPLLLAIIGRTREQFASRNQDEPLSVGDDLFCTRLFLAARCLVGTPKIRLPGLRDAITHEVGALLGSRWELDRDRAALVLAEIGDLNVTERLRAELLANSKDAAPRISIARAFGKTGDNEVTAALSTLFSQRTKLKNPPLLVATITALGDAQVLEARSGLRELATVPVGSDEREKSNVARAACAALVQMRDREFAPLLLRTVKTSAAHVLPYGAMSSYGETLRALGSQEMADEIIAIASAAPGNQFETQSLFRAAIALGGKRIGRQVVALLCDPQFRPNLCFDLSASVEEIHDAYPVPDLLRAMSDDRLPWQRRWLIAKHLDRFPAEARDGVLALMDQELEPNVHTSVAAVLGAWGERWVLPHLRAGLENLPSTLTFSEGNFSVISTEPWSRVVSVLTSNDDDSYIPYLLEQLEARLQDWGQGSEDTQAIEAIGQACSRQCPPAIAERMVTELRRAADGFNPNRFGPRNPFVQALAEAVSAPVAPAVTAILRDNIASNDPFTDLSSDWGFESLIQSIGNRAESRGCVADLLAVLAKLDDRYRSDTCYQALFTLSQRLTIPVYGTTELVEHRRAPSSLGGR